MDHDQFMSDPLVESGVILMVVEPSLPDPRAALEAWARSLPPGTAAVEGLPVEAYDPDDEYGLEAAIAFRPARPGGCPLEIGWKRTGGRPYAMVTLDRWGRIAERLGLTVPGESRDRVGLFIEPRRLADEKLVEIGRAVAAGRVHLEVGAWRGQLVGTAGHLSLDGELLRLRGTGDGWLGKISSLYGGDEVRRVPYEPWG
jgi:hypothetical protein